MIKVKITKKEKEIIKRMEKEISEEIYCIAESILELDTHKMRKKIEGIVYKYIMKRFAREKGLENYRLRLTMKMEMKSEMIEATFDLGYT